MDGGAIGLVHLVELVDAADAVVRQHQRAALHLELVGLRVAQHPRREAHTGGALALRVMERGSADGGVYATRGHVGDVLEELGLGDARVAHQQNVDIPADLHAILRGARDAA